MAEFSVIAIGKWPTCESQKGYQVVKANSPYSTIKHITYEIITYDAILMICRKQSEFNLDNTWTIPTRIEKNSH